MPPFALDPEKDTVCDVTRRWAQIQPDAPALVERGREAVTYGGLVEAMDSIATVFQAAGIAPHQRIAVLHHSDVTMAALIFGAMKGATVTPVNMDLPPKGLEQDLHHRTVSGLIVDQSNRHRIEHLEKFVAGTFPLSLNIDDHRERVLLKLNEQDFPPRSVAKTYAFVLTSSGTTGTPKIIPCGHASMLHFAKDAEDHLDLGPRDRTLSVRPLHYAGALLITLTVLYSGGSIVYMKDFRAGDFIEHFQMFKPTWYAAGPIYQRHLLREIRKAGTFKVDDGFRLVFLPSGSLEKDEADEIESIFKAPVINSYNTSETARIAMDPMPPGRRKRGTVGLPVNCEVRIRSLDGGHLPVGERGEIVVRGPQVFEGYENDAKANAAAFVDDWFRTGDEGFFDEDGYLTLTGRIKEMINRGGEKVSPAEVDAALLSHPEVREAATFPIPHRTLGEEVAAAVVVEPGARLSDQDLTCFLLDHLAGFKIPRRFIFVDAIPKTETGKVQRYKLAEALGVGGDNEPVRGPDPGRDPSLLEAQLTELWKQALKLDQVGLNDNFFLLGGDSLQAIELFLQIERTLRRRLPAACLFEAGTVAEMASLIEDGEEPGCIVPIQPHGTHPPFFCIHGSHGVVVGLNNLAKQLNSDQPFYGIQSVGWDGKVVPFTNYEDMAAHYADEMRKIQPHGPYYLGGFSFGGRVAVYVARHLKAAGEEVGLLALLDTYSPLGRQWITLGTWLKQCGQPTGGKALVETIRYLWFRARRMRRYVYGRAKRVIFFTLCKYYRRTGKTVPPSLRQPKRANLLIRLVRDDMPPYDGDVTYFKADFRPGRNLHSDTQDTWRQIIKGRLDIVPIPGNHSTFIKEPYVRAVASELQKVLETARAKVT
ncbi:MAG: non-ribosomal peptide synthetase [Alphaproteobacteria bacterium]|nr:non-ribosomal peptide synthetase [Alphaproteobacteria bacterium]